MVSERGFIGGFFDAGKEWGWEEGKGLGSSSGIVDGFGGKKELQRRSVHQVI